MPALLVATVCLGGCNWLQFAGSSSHQGNNSTESTLTAANVSGLHQVFRDVRGDRFYQIEEGKDKLSEQKFSPHHP